MSDLKTIDRGIASIRRRSTTLRTDINKFLVMIMEHAEAHGDCTRALRIVEAVPMASERAKIIAWLTAFSPINVTWNADVTKRRVGLRNIDAKAYNAFNLDGARANPYYLYGKSDDEETAALLATEVNTFILKLADKFQKRLDKGEVAANDKGAVVAKVAALRQAAVAVAA